MSAAPPSRVEHIGRFVRPEKLLEARTEAEGDQSRQATGRLHCARLEEMAREVWGT